MGDLRPYQAAAVESALRALTMSGSAVLQMPTGAGKTKAATEIIKRADKPVWFICHRVEIIRQAAKAFREAGIDFGVVSPAKDKETGRPYPLESGKPVQIASIGTLARRIAELPLPALAIWDECHHAPAKSWAAIREQLGGAQNLGLTATPERLDGKGLSEWFAELIVGPTIENLIADGWLSKFRYFAPSDPDLTAAKMQAGDYNKKDADKAMNRPVLIGDAVAEYRRNAAGKRAIAFCTSIEASKALVERFNREGIPAAHVDGTTPTDRRDEAVRQLADGEIRVLSNVDVFTEGFDVPGIDAVILLRPTKSPTLLLQMIGRALRPQYRYGFNPHGATAAERNDAMADGPKPAAIIMDHAGLWQDHGSFADNWHWNLEGGAAKARRKAGERGPRRCPRCKEVFAEREPVCACGYEFPTGREVGEFDGVLTEVRGVVPEGCVTQAALARALGVSRSTVKRWIQRGMPNEQGFVKENACAQWVKDNWEVDRTKSHQAPEGVDDPENYETRQSFAMRFGVSIGFVNAAIKRGMKSASNGWVHVPSGSEWMEENWHPGDRPPREMAYDGEFISVSDFCDMVGITRARFLGFVHRGLPTARNGWPHKDHAILWIKSNVKHQSRPPLCVGSKDQYEQQKAFAQRIKVGAWMISSWRGRGLPCASNGWVHIQRGLEWVRDNTNTVIPPEAWPDNSEAPTKRAA